MPTERAAAHPDPFQLPLFPAAARTPTFLGTGFSMFRMPIVTWVGIHGAVTERQLLYRFWVYDGFSASHGFRVVRHLVAQGLLERHPLTPWAGRRSQHVVTLTRAGWAELPPVRPIAARVSEAHLMQLAQVALIREAAGWTFVRWAEAWPRLRDLTLKAAQARLGRQGAQEYDLLSRVRDPGLKVWGLVHAGTGDVRLLVPARSTRGLRRVCRDLTKLAHFAEFQPLELELVAADVPADLAEKRVREWFRGWRYSGRKRGKRRPSGQPRRPIAVNIHAVPPYGELPHPHRVAIPAESAYARAGVPGPLTARSATIWLATRPGGVL
jgi:hypothetical protein